MRAKAQPEIFFGANVDHIHILLHRLLNTCKRHYCEHEKYFCLLSAIALNAQWN